MRLLSVIFRIALVVMLVNATSCAPKFDSFEGITKRQKKQLIKMHGSGVPVKYYPPKVK